MSATLAITPPALAARSGPRKNYTSRHRMPVIGRITSRGKVLELTFDVRQEAAGAEAEERRLHVLAAQLLLHQDQPRQRVLGLADAACRLEADAEAGLLPVLADGAHHHQRHRQRGVDRLL